MKLSICPAVFDLSAPLRADYLLPGSDVDQVKRRVSRTATLDGGSVYYDAGFSVSDRTVEVKLPVHDQSLVDQAKFYAQYYSELSLSIPDGVYWAVIEDITFSSDELTITLLIKRSA